MIQLNVMSHKSFFFVVSMIALAEEFGSFLWALNKSVEEFGGAHPFPCPLDP